MRFLVVGLMVFGGCTINVVDKRLSRDEVAVAFRQRDAVLELITKEIERLQQALKVSETKGAK